MVTMPPRHRPATPEARKSEAMLPVLAARATTANTDGHHAAAPGGRDTGTQEERAAIAEERRQLKTRQSIPTMTEVYDRELSDATPPQPMNTTETADQSTELSRKDRKSLELALKQINQVKAFRAAAQQPYVKAIDSKGDVEMLFCDTGNNTASVMVT
jgi:hypothetical protein